MILGGRPGGKTVKGTRILLLRHAETAAPDRFHGAESDVGLGPRGARQAAEAARALAAEGPAAVVSSAMLRARQTAGSIAEACGLVPRVVPTLHERRMGPLSGRTREEGMAAYEEARRRWIAGELTYTHEGGESYADIRARVVPAFREVAEGDPGRTIVVVAHGVVIRVLLTTILPGYSHADFGRVPIDNVAVNDLRWSEDGWVAAALNRHLAPDDRGDVMSW